MAKQKGLKSSRTAGGTRLAEQRVTKTGLKRSPEERRTAATLFAKYGIHWRSVNSLLVIKDLPLPLCWPSFHFQACMYILHSIACKLKYHTV